MIFLFSDRVVGSHVVQGQGIAIETDLLTGEAIGLEAEVERDLAVVIDHEVGTVKIVQEDQIAEIVREAIAVNQIERDMADQGQSPTQVSKWKRIMKPVMTKLRNVR